MTAFYIGLYIQMHDFAHDVFRKLLHHQVFDNHVLH